MPGMKLSAKKKLKKSKHAKKKLFIPFFAAFLVFGLDSTIKAYLCFNYPFQSFPLIENIAYITVVFNTGTAFGLLPGRVNLLIGLSLILMLIFLLVVKLEKQKTATFLLATGLILGGAASNLIDRLILGAVVDYINLKIWPVFNLSDAAITTGAVLLILDSFRKKKDFRP